MITTSIIIINYNTQNYLRKCLDSINNFTHNLEYEVIVVDNNSSDRSIEFLLTDYPKINFLFRDVNDGFGAGCNFGARHATGKYFLFINPDVILLDNVVYELFKLMESDPCIAVVSPIYIEDDNNVIYTYNNFPGFVWEFSEAFGNIFSDLLFKLFPRQKLNLKEPFEVNWVMGSFMFIKAEIFKLIQGFDENFFLYYEDIDLQFRIKKLGYKINYYPNALVKHIKRGSVRSYSGENLYYYHMTRSNLIYMYKHFGFVKRNLIRIFHLLGIMIRFLTLPLRSTYTFKKKQKLFQYITKLKQFLSCKKSIFNREFLKPSLANDNMKQITVKDSFWQ